MIFSVITACFGFLEDIFNALASIEVIDGVSLFNVCLSFIIISTVMFGLISTVPTRMLNGVNSRLRLIRNTKQEAVRRETVRNMANERKAQARAEAEFDRYTRSDSFKHKYSLDDKKRFYSRFYRG